MSTWYYTKMAEAVCNGSSNVHVGRPSYAIDMDDIKYLLSLGFSKCKVAEFLGISRKTLYNKIASSSAPMDFNKYSVISEPDLDAVVRQIKQEHPNDGEIMLAGHLLKQGIRVQRAKLRASIHRIDPQGVAARRSVAVKRREYHVLGPNEVWHLDGHHKLIKWRLVTHGAIDGYSRMITFLQASSNNRADTVIRVFRSAVEMYGLPKKVRTDHGGENIEVWRMMMEEYGNDKCVIVGSSAHNERIERLWRDVHRSVIIVYGNIFREMEAEGILDPLNEVDLYCLHFVFIPRINSSLESFREGWNNHSISTENNRTPSQLFISGLIPHLQHNEVESDSDSESDLGSLQQSSHDAVSVPRCLFRPCESLSHAIENVNPQNETDPHGRSMYRAIVQICGVHLTSGCDECTC